MAVLVVMGVCGSGKTTIGRSLSRKFGCKFVDADDWHPPSNVDKMSRGIPLTDKDRQSWLEQLHVVMMEWVSGDNTGGESVRGVLACSALKRSYRDILVDKRGSHDISSMCVFVCLHSSDETLLRERLAIRSDHFMPPSLLTSQLDTLELPEQDELALVQDISQSVEDITQCITVYLKSMSLL